MSEAKHTPGRPRTMTQRVEASVRSTADWYSQHVITELDAERSVADELAAALQDAIKDCRCSLAERDSGHLIDCFAPAARAALARWSGAKEVR